MASPDQMVTLASLGRPFRLGMVYDCRNDTLIPGLTLWDPSKLRDSIDCRPQPNTQTQITASDSLSEKSTLLDISASLKGSVLGNFVQADGAARFLTDTKKSAQQARVTLSYSCTTHFEQLTMGQLARENIRHPDVFDKGIATHVVTGILYGARAVFVFDQQASSSKQTELVQKHLRIRIAMIPIVSMEKSHLSEEEMATVRDCRCTFYGDLKLKKTPSSYMEAIELYAALPGMVGADGENAVPVKVWLYPLSLLDSKAAKLVREISSRLIGDCEKAVERLLHVDMRTNDLLGDPACVKFPAIREKIQTFRDRCQQYKLVFQKQLAATLPTIRGGGAEEILLAEILKRNEQLPFSHSRLSAFLDLRQREMRFVKYFVDLTERPLSSVSSQDDFMQQLLDPKKDTTYAFAFTSLQAEEPYLEELAAALEAAESQGTVPAGRAGESRSPWFEDSALMEGAKSAALLFKELADTRLAKGTAQFVVTSVHDESSPGAGIFRYRSGSLRGTKLDVLPKPSPPEVSQLSAANVELVFKPAESTEQRVTGYELQYRPAGEEAWVSQHAPKATHTVTLLNNDAKFEFRYAVESAAGRSPFSDVIASYNGYGFFLHEQKC